MLNDPCDECPAFLQPLDVPIVLEMSEDGIVYPARRLAERIGFPGVDKKAVKATQKRLRDMDLAQCGNLTGEDGLLAGRGTWLNWRGLMVQSALQGAAGPDAVERSLEKGWFLDIFARHKGDRRVMGWTWAYALRRQS